MRAVPEIHTGVCKDPRGEDSVQWMTEVCKLLWCSLLGTYTRRVSGVSMAFRSILSKIAAKLRGRPGAPFG